MHKHTLLATDSQTYLFIWWIIWMYRHKPKHSPIHTKHRWTLMHTWAPSVLAKNPLTLSHIWLLSPVGKGTISIHSQVKWLCSSHRYLSSPTTIRSDGNIVSFSSVLLWRMLPVSNTYSMYFHFSSTQASFSRCWLWRDWNNCCDIITGAKGAILNLLCHAYCAYQKKQNLIYWQWEKSQSCFL